MGAASAITAAGLHRGRGAWPLGTDARPSPCPTRPTCGSTLRMIRTRTVPAIATPDPVPMGGGDSDPDGSCGLSTLGILIPAESEAACIVSR